ncbi:MAG: dienelactone hydrolase family protein [Gammaproteobacteria bacterium]|nr:dienelactone hydrolase family protein [Gammaproteobacteria bacterium]
MTLLALSSSSMLAAAEQTVQLLDGTSIKLFFFEPHDEPANAEDPPPLVIFIAGGSNNEFMAKAQFWLGKEFVDRGWAIAVPISPDGKRFSKGDSSTLPQIVKQLHATHALQDSKPLLVGMSSGGSEAMAIAFLNPANFRGVVATPGRIKPDVSLDKLDSLPFYIRIGERDDFRWNRMLESMSLRLLSAGAKVDAEIVEDARHVFQLDWESLEAWLNKLK